METTPQTDATLNWQVAKRGTQTAQERIRSRTGAFGGSEIIYQPCSSGTMTMKEGLARESCKGLDVADWSSAQEIPRGRQHVGYAVFSSSSSLECHTAFQI